MRILLALALFAAPAAAADQTDDPVRTLTIVNDSGAAVNQLFVSGGKTKRWREKVSGIVGQTADERDRLEARLLPRGGAIPIVLTGERCDYDVRAILENGRTYAGRVDVCARARWTVTQLAAR